jgi:hypothetical protein
VDLDGDGYVDLISGSWPGELFFFRGGPGRTFAAPEMLKDKAGNYINIGGGIKESQGQILVYGTAKYEDTKEGKFFTYQGKRVKVDETKVFGMTGTASAVHAVDWDGDGDYDLLVGDIGGNVWLVPNEGTAKKYAFGKEQPLQAGGRPIRVEGDAGPFAADWDGDGLIDLLVGSGDGGVWLYRNVGTAKAPKLAAGVRLVPPGKAEYGPNAPKEARRGSRAKVCAVDWDGDGRLDLLVGDFATQKPNRPEPSAKEQAVYAKLRKERDEVQAKYGPLVQKLYGPTRLKDVKEKEKLQKELQELGKKMQELYAQLPPEYENHGWVWLFLRKPAAAKVGAR